MPAGVQLEEIHQTYITKEHLPRICLHEPLMVIAFSLRVRGRIATRSEETRVPTPLRERGHVIVLLANVTLSYYNGILHDGISSTMVSPPSMVSSRWYPPDGILHMCIEVITPITNTVLTAANQVSTVFSFIAKVHIIIYRYADDVGGIKGFKLLV